MNSLQSCCFSFAKEPNKKNEDSILAPLCIGDIIVFAVADGVGGYAGAAEAANIAINTCRSILLNTPTIDMEVLFTNVRHEIITFSESNPYFESLSTTLSLCKIQGNKLTVAHTGDCRAFLASGVKLFQITKDQTEKQMLLDNEVFTEDELKNYGRDNILRSSISPKHPLNVLISNINICEGDMVFIISDGVYKTVGDTKLKKLLIGRSIFTIAHDILENVQALSTQDDYSMVCIRI